MSRLIERLAADAWPRLERVDAAGWRLRAAAGVTQRANSALPLDPPGPGLAAVERFYDQRGLVPRVQVSQPELDRELEAAGWLAGARVLVMTGPVPAGPTRAHVAWTPDDAWLDCWWAVDGRGGRDAMLVARSQLALLDRPAAYVSLLVEDEVVAVGRGVVDSGWLGVFAMGVRTAHRRRGLGRQVLCALGTWARDAGAASAYLQVLAANHAARGLYAGHGFVPAYGYHYRSRP